MSHRPLPPELLDAFARVRSLEDLAGRSQHRRYAASRASGRLLLACLEVGWRASELAPAAGIAVRTVQTRAAQARRLGDPHGLAVPAPPVERKAPAKPPAITGPAEDREWLTLREASAYAGAAGVTINVWQSMGLLPNTRRRDTRNNLYLRADLERVMQAPRSKRGGVDRRALAEHLRAAAARSPCASR